MAEINIKYSRWQKPLSSAHLSWIARTIEQDINRKKNESSGYPINGVINVKGLEDNVLYGYSTINYKVSWTKIDQNDPDSFMNSIEITID